jgi:cysteinyl-tRNA synthetase
MVLTLFNTLSRKKEDFVPINPPKVGFYSCGPTVYWYAHIGNLRTYLFNDLLKRVLLYNDFRVEHVMNYTDVGHLTSDEDHGDDKMELAASKENKTAEQIAKKYSDAFEEDCEKLNIISPDIVCLATEHIKEQIDMIKKLEEKGFTYKTVDGIYFDTSKIEDYGKLANLNIAGIEEGKRVSMGEKRNKTDFALWKFSEEPGKRQQEWKSPWGIGFPGWHIECSAMSSKYLGDQFDIHSGGEDHIHVHHPNEIAQSECCYDKKPWVKYWLHGAFLTFKGEKVSKSKGGIYTVSELEKLGFDPLDYRYLCLNTHYRKQLSFSLDTLKSAKNTYDRLKNIVLDLKNNPSTQLTDDYDIYVKDFEKAINDDLNIPVALSVLWNVLRDKKLGAKEKLDLAFEFDKVLGLDLKGLKDDHFIPGEINALVEQREQARKDKDYALADSLRDKIKEKGFEVRDSENGPEIKPLTKTI